jgi:hypothetical protein
MTEREGRVWHAVPGGDLVECLPGCGHCGLNSMIYDASIKDLVSLPTAAERKDARVATLLEGHAAGLHTLPVGDCPSCSPVETPERDRLRRHAARALDRYAELMYEGDLKPELRRVAGERLVELVGDYVLSRLHHNSHYGVTASDDLGQSRTVDLPAKVAHGRCGELGHPDGPHICTVDDRPLPASAFSADMYDAHKPHYGVPNCTTCGRAVRIGSDGPEHVEPPTHVNGIHVPTLPQNPDYVAPDGDDDASS